MPPEDRPPKGGTATPAPLSLERRLEIERLLGLTPTEGDYMADARYIYPEREAHLMAEVDRLLTVGRLAAVLFHPLRGDASWLHTTEFNDLRAALVVANLLPGEGTDNAHLGKQPEGGS